MSVELQIRTAALAALTSRSVRERLRSACLPAFDGFSIDHLEVVPDAASVESLPASAAVTVPIDVFIVTDFALFAAANSVPDGATVPAARITGSFIVAIDLRQVTAADGRLQTRSILTLSPGPVDLSSLPHIPGLNLDAVQQQLQALLPTLAIDLTPELAQLGMPSPHAADIMIVDGVLAVRFDPTDTPRAQLFAGQDWGLFVSRVTVERILVDRIEPPVMRAMPQARVSARYEAVGGVPRVVLEADLTVHADVIDLDVRLVVDLGAGLSLIPRQTPALRASIDWSFHIFADGVPGFLEGIAETFAEGIAQDLIHPEIFGGSPTGDRSFVIDLPLTTLELPGVLLRFDSLLGSDEGMTLGGAVLITGLYEPPLTVTVNVLASPLRIQLCSQLARTGSGARSPEPPTIFNTKSYGQVEIDGCGALCSVEQHTPQRSVQSFLVSPAFGLPLEQATLRYGIWYFIALELDQPLTLVVRTPRGVRLVDLGTAPKVTVDAAGVIQGRSRDYYVKDCLNVVPGSGAGAQWGTSIDDFKSRPLEEPDWSTTMQQAAGLIVQLVGVNGLDAGELLRFRSSTHAIDVIADARGRALVPVMLPLDVAIPPAMLVRADGRSLAGHISVDSVAFERHLSLPGSLNSTLVPTRSGGVRLATRSGQAMVVHTVSALAASSRVALPGEEVALNPQPLPSVEDGGGFTALNPQTLPPVESPRLTRAWGEHFGLHGLAQVFSVPGHAAHGAAIAVMSDGSKLLLDLQRHGTVRIAGTFAGPIGALESAGDWATASTDREVTVFRVITSEPAASRGGASQSEDHPTSAPQLRG